MINGMVNCLSTHGKNSKIYRLPRPDESGIEEQIGRENDIFEEITKNDTRSLWITIWGVSKWGDMFTNRQLYFLNSLSSKISHLALEHLDRKYEAKQESN